MDKITIYGIPEKEELYVKWDKEHVILISRELAITQVTSEYRERILATIPIEMWKLIGGVI